MFLILCPSRGLRKCPGKRCWPLAFTVKNALKKKKNRSGTSLAASFSALFLKKNICHAMFYSLNKFHILIALTIEILDNMCSAIICCPVCDVIKFAINHSFLIKPFFFYITKRSGQKCKYFKNEKSFWQEINKLSFLQGF